MISLLKNISSTTKLQIGCKAYNLWILHKKDFLVETSIIISQDEFFKFRSVFELDRNQIKLIKTLIDDSFPLDAMNVNIVCSENDHVPGLPNKIKTSKSIFQIKNTIEYILRLYWKEEATAWRLINKKSDENSLPGIIIQPSYENHTVATRSLQTGMHTSSESFSEKKDDNITEWKNNCYQNFIKKIEETISGACNISFRFDKNPIISSVEEENIPLPAYFHYLTDLLDNNVIDSLEYLMRLKPENLDSMFYINEEIYGIMSNSITVEGRPFNNGLGIGKLLIPKIPDMKYIANHNRPHKEKYIIACESFSPDWESILKCSNGAIGNHGNRHCHLAVIARELKIPAISLNVKIDTEEKVLILESGIKIQEFSNVVIIPNKNIAIFNSDCRCDSFIKINYSMNIYLRLIAELISKQLNPYNKTKLEESKHKHINKLFIKIIKINRECNLGIPELEL